MNETSARAEVRLQYRKLRIAFSVLCGIVCLLLIALWVRSYSWADKLYGRLSETRPFELASEQGIMRFTVSIVSPGRAGDWAAFSYRYDRPYPGTPPISGITPLRSTRAIGLPYWLMVASIAAMAYSSCRGQQLRFSLRTLLVGMTVVAIVLALVFGILR